MSNITALVPIADGSEDLECVTIIDILRRAKIEVTVASVTGNRRLEVIAARGTHIVADCHIDDCLHASFDAIVLPGGMPGAEHLRDSPTLAEKLIAQKSAGKCFAAICASPAVVFARHGLVNDRYCTAYPTFAEQLPHFRQQAVVVDGNCITSQGPATAMAFSLTLVEYLAGAEVREQVAQGLLAC